MLNAFHQISTTGFKEGIICQEKDNAAVSSGQGTPRCFRKVPVSDLTLFETRILFSTAGTRSDAPTLQCGQTYNIPVAHRTADFHHLELLHENLMYSITGDKIAKFFKWVYVYFTFGLINGALESCWLSLWFDAFRVSDTRMCSGLRDRRKTNLFAGQSTPSQNTLKHVYLHFDPDKS